TDALGHRIRAAADPVADDLEAARIEILDERQREDAARALLQHRREKSDAQALAGRARARLRRRRGAQALRMPLRPRAVRFEDRIRAAGRVVVQVDEEIAFDLVIVGLALERLAVAALR